jgi:hypothetical protein
MRTITSAGIVLVLVSGCGSNKPAGSSTPPEPTTAASATPTTTPAATLSAAPKPVTSTVLTREQAATRYLAIIKASNAVFDEPKCAAAEDFFVNGGSWPPDGHSEYGERADKVLRECHKRLVPLFQASIKALQTTLWPVDARADVADLILQNQAFLYCLGKSSKATSSDAMYRALECFPEDDGSADRVRARFGLPIRTAS